MPIPTGNFQKSDSYAQSVGRGAGGSQELTGKLTGGDMSRPPNCSESARGPRCYATNVDSRDLLRVGAADRRRRAPNQAFVIARDVMNRPGAHRMSSGTFGADRGLEWHRAVAPGVQVGETTTSGLALSRLKHGFEPR